VICVNNSFFAATDFFVFLYPGSIYLFFSFFYTKNDISGLKFKYIIMQNV
jgi:hypothetical protein